MKRALLTLSLSIVAVWSFLQFGGAQVVPQPGPPTPIACAYNSSPPTLSSGNAGWAQCDSTGQLKTSGTVTATTAATATAAAPSYVEGTSNPLSMDLAGGLRITGSISATSAATATAAAPSYVEGTSNPLSQNLTGDQRTIAKQSGTWNITNVSGTVSLPTGAATSALQTTGNTALTTINTTLGSPMQATGGTVAATQSGTWNITNVLGTVSLPTGAATSANQTTWQAATGGAPPANVIYNGALGSGATGGLLAGIVQCDSSAVYDASTNGSTELKALTSGRSIYVCGYSILSAGTVNVKLIYGTGTACATGSANMTPAFQLTAQVGLVDGSPFYRGMKTASANALCINTSAGVAVQAIVYYSVI